jgi:hypothetical protein
MFSNTTISEENIEEIQEPPETYYYEDNGELPADVITYERDISDNYSYPDPYQRHSYNPEIPEMFRNMTENEILNYYENMTEEELDELMYELINNSIKSNTEYNESLYVNTDELTFDPIGQSAHYVRVLSIDSKIGTNWFYVDNTYSGNSAWILNQRSTDGIIQEFIPESTKIDRISILLRSQHGFTQGNIEMRIYKGEVKRYTADGGGAHKRTITVPIRNIGNSWQWINFDLSSTLDVISNHVYYFKINTDPIDKYIQVRVSNELGYGGRSLRVFGRNRLWPHNWYQWEWKGGTFLGGKGDLPFRTYYKIPAPNMPSISGPQRPEVCRFSKYTFSSSHPHNVQFRYVTRINEGSWSYSGYGHSKSFRRSFYFGSTGTHTIEAYTEDIYGSKSATRTFVVDVPAMIPHLWFTQRTTQYSMERNRNGIPSSIQFRARAAFVLTCISETLTMNWQVKNKDTGLVTYTQDGGSAENDITSNLIPQYGKVTIRSGNTFEIKATVTTGGGITGEISTDITVTPIFPSISTGGVTYHSSKSVTMSGTVNCDGGLLSKTWITYSKYGPQTIWTSQSAKTIGSSTPYTNTYRVSGLTPATDYKYKAGVVGVNYDNFGDYYGSERYFFTPPDDPLWITVDKLGDGVVKISWDLPESAEGSRIQVRTPSSGSYVTIEDIYNKNKKDIEYQASDGAGTYTFRVLSLARSKRDNSWYTSLGGKTASVEISEPPIIITLNPTIGEQWFILRGYLEYSGSPIGCCHVRFIYDEAKTDYSYNTNQQYKCDGAYFNENITQLGFTGPLIKPGTIYVYKANARNEDYGWDRETNKGNEILFMTKPFSVINPQVTFYPEELPAPDGNNLKSLLTWGNGEGAKGAYIEVAQGTPPDPWNVGNGTRLSGIGYFNGTNTFHIGQSPNTTYHYKIWSFGKGEINLEGNTIEFISNGSELLPFGNPLQTSFTTPERPEPPKNIFLPRYGMYEIHLNWTKGFGADRTRIVAMDNEYPINRDAGRIVYDGPGIYVIDFYDDFGDYSIQHYRAYSYNETNKLWSIAYDEVNTSVIDYQLFFPNYLNVGEYVISWGKIISQEGENVEGFITTTTVRDLKGNTVAGPVHWNCRDGNFQTTISTTEMIAGTYEIVSNFKNTLGTEFIYDFVSKLYLSKEGEEFGSYYTQSNIHYTFYDVETGTGLDDNYYKVYISEDQTFSAGDRIKGGVVRLVRSTGNEIYVGKRYYMQIQDFNGNIIPIGAHSEGITTYNDGLIQNAYIGFDVIHTLMYVDLGIYLNQFRVKNMNESTVYMILRRMDGKSGQVLGRFIPPWGETEVFIPDGYYNLTIDYYDNNNPEWGPQERIYPWRENMHVDRDLFYHIVGYNLEDVCHEMIGDGTFIYYTIFDMNTGSKLRDEYYKIYFSKTTSFTERNRVMDGKYKTDLWNIVYFKIEDYWGNLIYPHDGSEYEQLVVESTKTFLDIGIPFNQFIITNQNNSLIYIRITEGNLSDQVNNTWYNRWVPPHGSTEIFIRSGTYNISIEYYYPHNGTIHAFRNISNMKIEIDTMLNILGENAIVSFNIFDTGTGLSPNYKDLKIYVDGVRIPNKYVYTSTGRTLNIKIKDYFNNILYNESIEVTEEFTYIDIPLELYSLKFANFDRDFFVTSIKKNQSEIWVERIVSPYETVSYEITKGNYSIRIYNATLNISEFFTYVDKSTAYVITGDNINKSVNLAIYGQNISIALNLSEMKESYKLSNDTLQYLLGHLPYGNETITSFKEEFRKPHIYVIPVLKEKYEDKLPPVTAIIATVTIDGGIRVRWISTDDRGETVDYVELFYKEENATWREWDTTDSRIGHKYLTQEEIDLVEGKEYTFMALGTDTAGNKEKQSTLNTVTIIYEIIEIDYPAASVTNILKEVFTNWILILAIIAISGSMLLLFLIEKKRNKEEMEEERRVRYERY